jgi:hypothetical protein
LSFFRILLSAFYSFSMAAEIASTRRYAICNTHQPPVFFIPFLPLQNKPPKKKRGTTMLRNIGIGLLVLFIAIQLVPYGRNHTNPPVTQEPNWDSARTRELAARACMDCHSNETEWLWYHNIAPISWGVQWDVDTARNTMNFSEWDQEQDEAKDAAEVIADGEMPPWRYTIVHPDAVLTPAEQQELMQGLARSIGAELDGEEGEAIEEQQETLEDQQDDLEERQDDAQDHLEDQRDDHEDAQDDLQDELEDQRDN